MKTLHIGETCSTCGTKVAPILWGMPTPETLEKAGREGWFIGGCCIGERMSRCECGARSYDGDGRFLTGWFDEDWADDGGVGR